MFRHQGLSGKDARKAVVDLLGSSYRLTVLDDHWFPLPVEAALQVVTLGSVAVEAEVRQSAVFRVNCTLLNQGDQLGHELKVFERVSITLEEDIYVWTAIRGPPAPQIKFC